MVLQLEWRFWLCVIAIFIVLRLAPIRPSTWFGALNAGALTFLVGPTRALVILGFAAVLWCGLFYAKRGGRAPMAALVFVALVVIFGILIWQKSYAEFAVLAQQPERGTAVAGLRLLEAISYTYIALRAWDAVSAIRDGRPLLNPIALSGYLAPFFMMPAGPINVYADHLSIDDQSRLMAPTWREFLRGVELITVGLFMKFVIGELLRLYFTGVTGVWPTASFASSAVIFIFIYFDFAGYSLVALGIGRLLQVPTPKNFEHPLFAASLTDFWSRWHMSLGDWVKRHIYFPSQMFLLRRTNIEGEGYLLNSISLIAAFTVVGLWHRFTLPFLLWGIGFGCLLALEKYVRDRFVSRALRRRPILAQIARLLGPLYVLFFVIGMLHLTAMGQMVGNPR